MTITSYICKVCAHFLRDTDAFNAHVAKHGINTAEPFVVTTIAHHCGTGWTQVIEKILTDKNFEFFRTTVTIETRSRSAAAPIIQICSQIGMGI